MHSATGFPFLINVVSPSYSGVMEELKEEHLPKLLHVSQSLSELLVGYVLSLMFVILLSLATKGSFPAYLGWG